VGQATTPSGQRGFVLTPEAPSEPVSTTVSAEAVKQVYGRVAELEVTVEPNAAGEVSVDTGAAALTAELVNGEATVPLPARLLAPGRHALAITYSGKAGEFSPSEGTVPVRVVKARPSVRITPVKAEVRRGATAVFKAVVDAVGVKPSGRVSVKVAGKARAVRLTPSGRAIIRVPLSRTVKPGVKRAVASYSGDAYVRKARSSTRIRIVR
jgi:large repetitive protein